MCVQYLRSETDVQESRTFGMGLDARLEGVADGSCVCFDENHAYPSFRSVAPRSPRPHPGCENRTDVTKRVRYCKELIAQLVRRV